MTKLLQYALKQVHQLSDAEQDAIARRILEEVASECRWDAACTPSQHKLAQLADTAWATYSSPRMPRHS
jgi:hypothetical protein